MPITEKQRQKRKNYLGSSDAAAVVGCDPWKSAADVYLSKVQDLAEVRNSEAAIIGNLCEGAVLDWFCQETGFKLLRNQFRVHATKKYIAAHYDALIPAESAAVEVKTAGILNFFDREQWGEINTDAIPERYILQCQHQMAVSPSLKTVWVPVLLGGVGFRLYKVDRNEELIFLLESQEEKFWEEHVLQKIPPSDFRPDLDLLKRVRRIPQKTVQVEPVLIHDWLKAKEIFKEAEVKKKQAESALLASLGDAEAAECELGTLTYLEQKRAGYTVKETTFRVTRFQSKGEENYARCA